MLLRLATLGALGYAAYRYYGNNRERVDGALRRLAEGRPAAEPSEDDEVELAGGPLSEDARLVRAGEGPVA